VPDREYRADERVNDDDVTKRSVERERKPISVLDSDNEQRRRKGPQGVVGNTERHGERSSIVRGSTACRAITTRDNNIIILTWHHIFMVHGGS